MDMKKYLFGAVALMAGALAACTEQQAAKVEGLVIERQGVFSSGGRVTEPIAGEYDPTQNWLDQERKGTTTHVDHANTLYQIPAGGRSAEGRLQGKNGMPVVFLHGYGQTRTGWQSTPDGREGWSDLFLKKGYSVFLVDQPLLDLLGDYAGRKGATMAQIALAWMLRKQPNVVPIPGSRNLDRIMENLGAWDIVLSDAEFVALERAIEGIEIYGHRGIEEYEDGSMSDWHREKTKANKLQTDTEK